jgi:hypothetical protein
MGVASFESFLGESGEREETKCQQYFREPCPVQ